MKLRFAVAWFLGAALAALPARADDWPQWRGPNRDGISRETGLLKQWPAKGPKLAWTFDKTGVGYSGPAIVGDQLFILGARQGNEELLAIDLKSGKEQWAVKLGPLFTFQNNVWGDGPRATPTVDGDLVYALGGQGELVCVKKDGTETWRKSLPRDLGGIVNPIGGGPPNIGWGYTCAPLVDGDHLLCVPGGPQGTLAALNKKTGAVIWRSKGLTDTAPYAAPVIAEIAGVRQYVQLTYRGLAGVAARDGALLWFFDREYTDVLIPTPLVSGNLVYVTTGFGKLGCDEVRVTEAGGKFKAEKVFSNKNMKCGVGSPVLLGGRVYGYSETRGWVCQDLKDGKIVWEDKDRLGTGSLIAADGHLYCLDEDEGVLALLKATTTKDEGYQEVSRFEIPRKSALRKPSGKVWTPPVIANGKLYLRDQELLFCFEIK